MCAILGIAPLGYLMGVTTRGLNQDFPTIFEVFEKYPSPIHIRMILKIPDLCNNAELSKMSCNFEELLGSLLHLYTRIHLDRYPGASTEITILLYPNSILPAASVSRS